MKQVKKFIVDALTNFIFWHPVFGLVEYFLIGLTLQQVLITRFGHLFFGLLLGGVYGRAIDGGRYLLNRKYYEETIHQKKRKQLTWKNKLQDASVDILTTCIFWGIIMFFWLYYGVQLSLSKVGELILTYTIIHIVASGFYGKVLNWSRKKFSV